MMDDSVSNKPQNTNIDLVRCVCTGYHSVCDNCSEPMEAGEHFVTITFFNRSNYLYKRRYCTDCMAMFQAVLSHFGDVLSGCSAHELARKVDTIKENINPLYRDKP